MAESPVICPACKRQVVVRKDGKMRQHQAWLSSERPGTYVQFPPPCLGANKTVDETEILLGGDRDVR